MGQVLASPMAEGYKAAVVPGGPGVQLVTSEDGDVLAVHMSQTAQLYTTVDRILNSQRILSLPLADRYTLAGKVAAVPEEFGRLIERLASTVATAMSEASALNALYLLEICKELVPGFKEKIPEKRFEAAADLSMHQRAKDFVLQGQRPSEWAVGEQPKGTLILMPEQEQEGDLLTETGKVVSDATKFVGGAAFGGVGLVTDTLGITKNAEEHLATGAEEAVDLVGHSVNGLVDAVDYGLDGTAHDLKRKGVVGAVGDGVADAVDIVSDFVSDTVTGIADGVHGMLNFATGTEDTAAAPESHLVKIVIAELIGAERTLGLRIENRLITAFTKPEAARFGWRLGDCIQAVGRQRTPTQEVMLEKIAAFKEDLRTNGTPMEFLVERLGARP